MGSRFLAFSTMIIGSSMLIQAYRNKSTIWDYSAGGAVAGGLLRMHYGLANLVFGSVVGSLMGYVWIDFFPNQICH
jgi:hypothetical protein